MMDILFKSTHRKNQWQPNHQIKFKKNFITATLGLNYYVITAPDIQEHFCAPLFCNTL